MFVFGIDPGLSRCGYCVLEAGAGAPSARALGVLMTDRDRPLPERLAELRREVRALFEEFPPDAVAVEQVFFQVNVRTAMSVGQASGVVMVEAQDMGAQVVQYTPSQVKSAVAGWGGADKSQIQRMVVTLLGLSEPPNPPDAADAAALALCHLAVEPTRRRVAAATREGTR